MESTNLEDMLHKIVQADNLLPKITKRIAYGTAGFRTLS